MKNYEAIFILKPDTEEKTKKLTTSIADVIKNNNGQVLKEDMWGKKDIAYPIKKHKNGVYYKVDFSVEPSMLEKMDKVYKLNTDILRTFLIKR